MRTILCIFLFLATFNINAQIDHESPMPYEVFIRNNTPLNMCGRSWMMSEERSDSLVREIKKLEDSLSRLDFVHFADTTLKYILLFETDHTFRIEYNGEVSHQFCITDTSRGNMLYDSILLKVVNRSTQKASLLPNKPKQQLKRYNETFLVLSEVYYYLGNCQFWTTRTLYCIREDEYENFIQP